MQALRVVPKIYYFKTYKEFNDEFKIGKRDVVLTNKWIYTPYMQPLKINTNVIFQEKFGAGEPTDEMIDAIAQEMRKYDYDRIIAFGGGTIADICKVLALDFGDKCLGLFTGEIKPVKKKELIVVPTTCGSGSEVTSAAVAELLSLHIKKGMAVEETFPDIACLVPEPLTGLPYEFFVTSSIDALVHAIESYLSPRATPFTEMYSLKAIEMIMAGYKAIVDKGEDERMKHLDDFTLASCYAGIAFGNAGLAAVHALAYYMCTAFHVAHGEANYLFFTEIFKMYQKKDPGGKIINCNKIIANVLGCPADDKVYDRLEEFLNKLIAKKPLREYGMTEAQIDEFSDSTVGNQQGLLVNNYVFLDRAEIREIFANLY